MKKYILSLCVSLFGFAVPAIASDFPADPQGVKVLDRNYYSSDSIGSGIYVLLYDKGNDRILEIFKASQQPDGSSSWKSAHTHLYRKAMEQDFLTNYPFELLFIGEGEGKSVSIVVVGMLETEPGLTLNYNPKTGAVKEELEEEGD